MIPPQKQHIAHSTAIEIPSGELLIAWWWWHHGGQEAAPRVFTAHRSQVQHRWVEVVGSLVGERAPAGPWPTTTLGAQSGAGGGGAST